MGNTRFRLNNVRLQCIAIPGDINQKKRTKLEERLRARYPLFANAQPAPSLVLTNPSTMKTILILPDSVIFMIEGHDVELDVEGMRNDVREVFDALLLDERCPFSLHAAGVFEAPEGGAMRSSLVSFTSKAVRESLTANWTSLRGCGLRFFFEEDGDMHELKVEPLLKNDALFYVDTTRHSQRPQQIDSICSYAQTSIQYLTRILSDSILPAYAMLGKGVSVL